jgi:pimeloyl-ACP methyl ester carboxylesterase
VLLVVGKRDVMTPPKAAVSLSEKIKAETVTVSNSGHSLMAEAPDATLDALIQFFK